MRNCLVSILVAALLFFANYILAFIILSLTPLKLSSQDESHVKEITNIIKNGPLLVQSIYESSHLSLNQNKCHDEFITEITTTVENDPVLVQSLYESGHLNANPNICSDLGSTLQLLIMVTSALKHSEARMGIRLTWGYYSARRDVSIAFMLGSTDDATLNAELDTEEHMYGDIIRGKFVDTYKNLTLKTMSILEWVDSYCPNVAFVLKTDDDMFIDVMELLSFIGKHKRSDRVIYGDVSKGVIPDRNNNSKHYLPWKQYNSNVVPDFVQGHAYLMPSSIVRNLYLAALNQTYINLEDVFITGIVANYINVERIHVKKFLNPHLFYFLSDIQITTHNVRYKNQFHLWQMLLNVR